LFFSHVNTPVTPNRSAGLKWLDQLLSQAPRAGYGSSGA